MTSTPPRALDDFGGKIAITLNEVIAPCTKAEILVALTRCRGRNTRVIGRLNSWSDLLPTEDLLFDLQHMNAVQVEPCGDQHGVIHCELFTCNSL